MGGGAAVEAELLSVAFDVVPDLKKAVAGLNFA